MNEIRLAPEALLHLIFNGSKAVEVVEAAMELGVIDALAAGPERLEALAHRLDLRPLRLYKLLDCLESLQLVRREQPGDDIADARYQAVPGLAAAAARVLGPGSLERERDRQPWRELGGQLAAFVRGTRSVPAALFDWPPRTDEQVASFEENMVAGLGPFRESFAAHRARLFGEARRWLDVGGGDGTLAAGVLASNPALAADVYNLPAVEPLVAAVREREALGPRLGFVAGDFLAAPLPTGYDVISFVRVLHDWPTETTRMLVEKAFAALPSGGRVAICEEFRTPERLAAQFFWSWFLVGVDSCVSRLRERAYYVALLEQVGFVQVEELPGAMEIVTARKPERS